MTATVDFPNAIINNGVMIVRTPKGVGVGRSNPTETPAGILTVQVYYEGRLLAEEQLHTTNLPWRNYYGNEVDHLKLWLRVMDGPNIVAELGLPPEEFIHPFMVTQPALGGQQHVTENYVSVPPALHITDSVGAVWTLGFATAPKDKSPRGEFAFEVLRDGIGTGVIASRIERRNGKIRAFTRRQGWLVWNGRDFL